MMKWTKCAIRFLRISRPGVRVPSIAPRKTSTHCVLVFLFCLRDGKGSNRAAAHSTASNQPSGLLLSPRVPTRRNVYRGSCEIERFHGFFCFVSHGCAVAERVRLISRRFKTEKMEFHIDKTSRQVYNRTWEQQGIAAKSVRMPLWIETG